MAKPTWMASDARCCSTDIDWKGNIYRRDGVEHITMQFWLKRDAVGVNPVMLFRMVLSDSAEVEMTSVESNLDRLDEASALLDAFEPCWFINHHPECLLTVTTYRQETQEERNQR